MKSILKYLKDFSRETFHPGFLLFFIAFLTLLLFANYSLDFEDEVIGGFRKQGIQLPMWFLYFLLPYLIVMLAWAKFTKNEAKLYNRRLWLFLLGGMFLLALNSWFFQYEIISKALPRELYSFAGKCLWNLRSWILIFLPLFLWYRWRDREIGSFYGLTGRGFDFRPWLIMLLLLMPLVFWASFQEDFLRTYPNYLPGSAETYLGVSPWLTTGFFQLCYGLDFTTVELFFRGFLVIGMLRFLGKGVVWPMLATYCVLHFGKPLGESISSVFGGYILAVIALKTRSIWGGVLVHAGLAWMMEAFAYVQIFVLK